MQGIKSRTQRLESDLASGKQDLQKLQQKADNASAGAAKEAEAARHQV